jgi:predicted small metal-binding protein
MRKYVDCRDVPSEMNCTVAIAADSDEELLEAAVQHAVAVHGHSDSPEFLSHLRLAFNEGTTPLEVKQWSSLYVLASTLGSACGADVQRKSASCFKSAFVVLLP